MTDQRRTREQWRDIVEGFPESGLTQAQYGARHAISVTSFHRWRERLRQGADPRGPGALRNVAEPVRLLPVEEVHEAPMAPVAGSALTLVLANGVRLEVGTDFEARTLRRVLEILQEPVAA
ncbi:IS66 family insertion sequence element accessory protein TnpA [Thiocystis violacea]|uniref:IS66 family insertion sequence element accessory protein TnpA n=1 Tax=Thiocystis violacea TaxID=13725 RepID=UPI001902E6AB|nr:IS66 family insertion sequence element accessory protein TnpB [Thiocystis violacea]MBK1720505.1 IS66 family insertion sequence hypothetical protein [Thiocystis violacea]